jgi:hypothetical protein
MSNFTIPVNTPFALTGSATDANAGDVLTYCWEQNNNSTTSGVNSVASPTKVTGPNWLSFSPTTSPTRTFPRLSTILAGLFVTPVLPGGDAGANIEALSSVTRTLNFRLTVRDNCPYSSTAPVKVGQTAFTDMIVTVTNTSGPFQVSSPNTNVSWVGGSTQTITWLVNNTTLVPVSCANVKISLSTDGGQTFPTVLLAGTANDGTEAVTMPVVVTTTARIKVEAVGNIFFDISNTNFTITACPTITSTSLSQTNVSCNGEANGAASVNPATGGTGPYTYNWTPGNPTGDGTTNVTGLTAGTWTCTVTDANSCAGVRVFNITEPAAVTAPTVSSPVTYCQGETAAVLSATGTNLLWYTVSSGGTGSATAPTASTTNAGTTSYYVSQSVAGCEGPRAQIDVVVKSLPILTVNNVVNNECHDGNTGSITVTGSVAAAPFTYTIISGPTINVTGQLTGIFTDLEAGSYVIAVQSANGCNSSSNSIIVTEPPGMLPDISLGSDYNGNFFLVPATENTIVYNVAEIAGNPATGDTIRIIKIAGYNFSFDGAATSFTIGATSYPLDNSRWKLDVSDPAFASLILDPNQNSNPGTLNCGGRVYVSLKITRNTANISSFTLSSRLRRSDGEASLSNNLNTIAFTAE